jgi:L-amino acid N-acyltransferase YncA
MHIRPALYEDSDEILLWRNDSLSREMSKSLEMVDPVLHDKWIKLSLKNQFCIMLIGIEGGVKVGVCRFDIDKVAATVSININPTMRNKGLGKTLLHDSIVYFKSLYNDISLMASIRKENVTSNKSFLACNFYKVAEDDDYIYYRIQ